MQRAVSFVDPAFLPLFAIVFLLTWVFPRRAWQNLVLLGSSAVFYGWIHPWFLALLAFSAILDYSTALGMTRWRRAAGWFLAISLIGNLGVLGLFKYYDFFVGNVAAALYSIGLPASIPFLRVVLPVGISFYTFQTLSYSIDVYRGTLPARRSFLDYATFVGMFPHLVAGPVMRARDLLPQVERDRRLTLEAFQSGLSLALWGAFKKIVCADTIAPYVDRVFAADEPDAWILAAGTLGFAVQILADFSGYTDIARGVARMLGLELMENFRHPHLAATPSEHWQRWHISFSTWIHDYVYVPLGGNRHGELRRHLASATALIVSGLWHGAAWNYVLWGVYHAILNSVYRVAEPHVPAFLRRLGRPAAVPLMFLFTCFGYLLFREHRLSDLVFAARHPLGPLTADRLVSALVVVDMALWCAAPMVIALLLEKRLAALEGSAWRLPVRTLGWALAGVCIVVFSQDSNRAFVYFQF